MTEKPDSNADAFCVVEFVRGSRVEKDPPVSRPASGRPASGANLRIVQNGPPGTFVRFADGGRVPLPTDQIVSADGQRRRRARRLRRNALRRHRRAVS